MTTASPRAVDLGGEQLSGSFDPSRLKQQFPIFQTHPDLVFLDTGASAQKPASVIDRIADYYRTDYANVNRGVYRLSARSTELFEEARVKAQRFLNAADPREIVFVRGATEAINLVAQSWGGAFLEAGDEVVISELEHHSNIVPWQLLRDRIGIRIVVTPIDATGGLDLAAFAARLSPRTRLVAVTHIANATGALVPIETIVELAHRSVPECWLMAVKRRRGCRSMCRRWAATFTPSPGTRPMARPGSAFYGAATNCWPQCRPGKAAAI